MSGNGVVWSAGDLNTAGHTLINHSPFAITAGGVNFTGTISNFSTLTDVSGYGRDLPQLVHPQQSPPAVVEWQSAQSGSQAPVVDRAVHQQRHGEQDHREHRHDVR